LVCAAATAQTKPVSECPRISVTGPAGLIRPGEVMTYTVNVENAGKFSLLYSWSVNGGNIENGQGTSAIKVRRVAPIGSGPAAVVQVRGLPQQCPNTATETSPEDLLQQAEKLAQIALPLGSTESGTFQRIADSVRKSPYSQLYIFIPPDVRVQNEVADRLERAIPGRGIDGQRITFVHTNGKNSVIQIWLVPPGATPPKCEGCEPPAPIVPMAPANCPTLEVTGPSGITAPGGIMPFAVIISDPSLRKLTFAWTVSAGTIVEGQGTRVIKVRGPASGGDKVSATVNVVGLPDGCISVSSYKK
jgi:hypothetical protein